MKQFRIEKLKIGDSAKFGVLIDKKVHESFRKLSGDNSLVHTEDLFAKNVGFKEKIAYGFNVSAYLSRFYGEFLPGGSSICLQQELKFLKPIYLNDKIIIKGEIININKNQKVVTIKNEIANSAGKICLSGKGFVKIIL